MSLIDLVTAIDKSRKQKGKKGIIDNDYLMAKIRPEMMFSGVGDEDEADAPIVPNDIGTVGVQPIQKNSNALALAPQLQAQQQAQTNANEANGEWWRNLAPQTQNGDTMNQPIQRNAPMFSPQPTETQSTLGINPNDLPRENPNRFPVPQLTETEQTLGVEKPSPFLGLAPQLGNIAEQVGSRGIIPNFNALLKLAPQTQNAPMNQPIQRDEAMASVLSKIVPQMQEDTPIQPNGTTPSLRNSLNLAPQLADVPIDKERGISVIPQILDDGNAPQFQDPAIDATRGITPTIPKLDGNAPLLGRTSPQTTQEQINEVRGKQYQREKKDKDGNIIQERGKDRDTNWTTKEKLANFAKGALLGLSKGGVAGAIAGGILGGTDRNFDEKLADQAKLGKLIPQLKQENEQQDAEINRAYKQNQIANSQERTAQNERRLKLAEQKNADTEYDRGFKRAIAKVKLTGYRKGENPQQDEELKRYGIEIEQWDNNNKTFWQGQNLMTFDQNGTAIPVFDESGKPIADPTRAPVTVEYGGQQYTVSNTVAFQGATNAGRVNTGIKNQDIDDENQYKNDVTNWENNVTKAGGEVSAIDTELIGLRNKDAYLKIDEDRLIGAIETNKDDADLADQVKADTAALRRIQDERRDTQAKIEARDGDLAKAKQVYDGLKTNKPQKPQKRQTTETPKVSGNKPYAGMKFQNPASLKSQFPNKSDEEIRQYVTNLGGTFIQ